MTLTKYDQDIIDKLLKGDTIEISAMEELMVTGKHTALHTSAKGVVATVAFGAEKLTEGASAVWFGKLASLFFGASLITLGYGGFVGGIKFYNYKKAKEMLDNDVRGLKYHCETSAWMCLKEEYRNIEENPWNFSKYNGNHNMITAYKTLHENMICTDDLKNNAYYKEYLDRRDKYLIPEKIERFEEQMHLLYACNKYLNINPDMQGQFKHERLGKFCYWSAVRERREALKKEIQSLLNKDCTFKELRDKYYASWNATTYLDMAIMEGKHKKEDAIEALKAIIKPYNDYEAKAIPKGKESEVRKLFLEYRYLGGACEFDYEMFMKMYFFKDYCGTHSYSHSMNQNNKETKIMYGFFLASDLFITGFFASMLAYNAVTQYNHELIKTAIGDGAGGIASQCANGSAIACEKMAQVNEYLSGLTETVSDITCTTMDFYDSAITTCTSRDVVVNLGYGNPSHIVNYIANNATAEQVPSLVELAGKSEYLANGIVKIVA